MLLCAMAPAREPAKSRSWIRSISWSVPMNRLICRSQNRQTLRPRDLSQPSLPFQLVFVQTQLSVPSPAHRPWTWWLTRVQSSARWCHCLSTVTWGHLPGSSEWSRRWCTCCYCARRGPAREGQAGLVPVPITTLQRFSVIQGQNGAFLFTQRFAKALIPSR